MRFLRRKSGVQVSEAVVEALAKQAIALARDVGRRAAECARYRALVVELAESARCLPEAVVEVKRLAAENAELRRRADANVAAFLAVPYPLRPNPMTGEPPR